MTFEEVPNLPRRIKTCASDTGSLFARLEDLCKKDSDRFFTITWNQAEGWDITVFFEDGHSLLKNNHTSWVSIKRKKSLTSCLAAMCAKIEKAD